MTFWLRQKTKSKQTFIDTQNTPKQHKLDFIMTQGKGGEGVQSLLPCFIGSTSPPAFF